MNRANNPNNEEILKGMEQCVELEKDIAQAMEDRKLNMELENCNGEETSSSSNSNRNRAANGRT